MKKLIIRISVVLTLLVIAVVVQAQEQPPAKVILANVVSQDVAATRSVTGVLYYERTSEVSTEVAGLVESIKVNLGDHVSVGQPLVMLNKEILEHEILLTKNRIAQIELRIDNAEKNFKRLETLFKSSGVSEKDYDDALYTYEDAVKEKQVTEDTLAKLLIQERRSVIKAPFDGIVLTKDVDSGAWVQQGKKLMTLGADNSLYVRAPIAEELLKFVTPGEKTEVILNAYDERIEGTIVGIDPIADMKTKNIFLRIQIAPKELVAENMSATVQVPSSEKRTLSVLPRAAMVKFQGKDFVYSIKEGKAAIMPINIVAYIGDKIAVDNPYIVPGMPVITEGNERLRPDQPVVAAGE